MSLIQRQDALIAILQPVHAMHIKQGFLYGDQIAKKSIAKMKHRKELVEAGYSTQQAKESVFRCDEVAYRNADHEDLMQKMGAGVPT